MEPTSGIANQDDDLYGYKERIIVCIPAYNEEKTISKVIEKSKRYSHEVIVYDDGSTDNTAKISEECGATVIRNPINKGYGTAIATLFRNAKARNADIAITLDSDGQHDPTQIPILLPPILRDECDIVIGSRYKNAEDRHKVPVYRDIGIRVITTFARAASYKELSDSQSGFRAYNKRALSKLELYETGMAVSTEILLKGKENGLRIKEVPVSISYGKQNTSTHNPVTHALSIIQNIVQLSSFRHPLLFYGVPGLILLVVSAFFIQNALEIFSGTRYVSTPLILIAVGLAVLGMILLATGAIVYTLTVLLRGKIKGELDI